MPGNKISQGLRSLINTSFLSFKGDTDNYVKEVNAEGDRAALIMYPAAIEQTLTHMISIILSQNLNKKELDSFLDTEGLAGTFSKRIRLAQAMGMIDRGTRKRLDHMRELRNAAAHTLAPISFKAPAIADAILDFYPAAIRERPTEDVEQLVPILFKVAYSALLLRVGLFLRAKGDIDAAIWGMFKEWTRAAVEESSGYDATKWIQEFFEPEDAAWHGQPPTEPTPEDKTDGYDQG